MRWEQQQWEEEYMSFVSDDSFPSSLSELDYFSVDLFEKHCPVFKAYFAFDNFPFNDNSVIQVLRERNMLGYCEAVLDSSNTQIKRVDIALSNRTPSNMSTLYKCLSQTSPAFHQIESEVSKLNESITSGCAEESAMYHLGLGLQGEIISTVKCYFNVAKCHKRHLPVLEIAPFSALSGITEQLLSFEESRPWMVGIDGGKNRKYKIYIRHFGDSLWQVIDTLGTAISAQAYDLMNWLKLHKEFFYTGIAVCLNEQSEFSANLYFMT